MNLESKKREPTSQVCGSTSFFTQTLQRLESVSKLDRQMAVRLMKIAIRSVMSSSGSSCKVEEGELVLE